MKIILAILVLSVICSCGYPKEIQVEMVNATLVRVDTLNREIGHERLQFTWRDESNIEYTSFEDMSRIYAVGTIMAVLRKR